MYTVISHFPAVAISFKDVGQTCMTEQHPKGEATA